MIVKTHPALIKTQETLDGIVASIQHVPDDAIKQARIATRVALSKTGFAGGAALGMQAAAAIGTASTGTALSSLSGAALYSSQMAWLGFGSMAVGGVVLVGIGAAGGKALNSAYTRFYSGKIRKANALSSEELTLLLSAQRLSACLDDVINDSREIDEISRVVFALDGIYPIAQQLRLVIAHGEGQTKKIAKKHRYKLKRHYYELMLTCENLAQSINAKNLKFMKGNSGGTTGIDKVVLEQAMAEVGEDSPVELRRCYLAVLEQGTRYNLIESGEVKIEQTLEKTFAAIGKSYSAAKDVATKHVPIFADKVAGTISKNWDTANLPEITNREELSRQGKAGVHALKAGGKFTAKGFKKANDEINRGKEKLNGALRDLKDKLPDKIKRQKKDQGPRSWSALVVLAVTFQKLLSDEYANLVLEEEMVLKAMRIALPQYKDAKPAQLAEYLQGLSPEQLQGVMSVTKGKYHELLYLQAQEAAGETVSLHEDLTHEGSDIVFTSENGDILEVQLKAVANKQSVEEHFMRYPGIEIRTTDEVASLTGVQSTGFSNAELSEDVRRRLEELREESSLDDMMDGAVTSLFIHAAIASRKIISGEYSKQEILETLKDTTIRAGTRMILELFLAS